MTKRTEWTTTMTPSSISARLRRVSEMSELLPERRLDAKIDLSPHGVSSRLREVADLLSACLSLAKVGRSSPRP